ncbi:BnaA02g30340D [Brassica napus]|uniref:(rape) hypothetical protein n=1 Tax=Brassica napus TaxID=3708 RepID=A0A078INV3_BRANA|nr:unnamed protein product [Brassica napus]CDY51054.1 BnaA02g30340D [Brassica napus]
MKVTRHVLSGYGNMSSACVFFILDEMRRKAVEDGAETTAEGLEWGVLFGFGPGLTVETVVLHSIPLLPSPKDVNWTDWVDLGVSRWAYFFLGVFGRAQIAPCPNRTISK